MDEKGFAQQKDLLNVDDVARYLEINPQTVWRWCREGRLPCMKVGKSWRIRRASLEDFLERSERPESLAARLRSFVEVPDNVLAITQSREQMHPLDAAFFKIGEARGGMLVKFYPVESEMSVDQLRDQLERNELEVARLEEEGRLRFITESGPQGNRVEELQRFAAEASDDRRSLWVTFNWDQRTDLDTALRQQEKLTKCIEKSLLVIKTSVLKDKLGGWPGTHLRRAQVLHLVRSGSRMTAAWP